MSAQMAGSRWYPNQQQQRSSSTMMGYTQHFDQQYHTNDKDRWHQQPDRQQYPGAYSPNAGAYSGGQQQWYAYPEQEYETSILKRHVQRASSSQSRLHTEDYDY